MSDYSKCVQLMQETFGGKDVDMDEIFGEIASRLEDDRR